MQEVPQQCLQYIVELATVATGIVLCIVELINLSLQNEEAV